ncbi:MAG: TetR/AcrR family transcriptional regulator [Syntrophomonadaceae bacterium]|nr:TetR/AcrR family transcriptional regulator [Syntrophomonadaceae bacterium]
MIVVIGKYFTLGRDKKDAYLKTITIFSEKGYHETTMEDIAENLGIAKGTLYYHYKNKKELYLALIKEGFEILKQQASQELALTDNAADKLGKLIQVQVAFFQEYVHLTYIFLRELYGNVISRNELTTIVEDYMELITQILNEGQQFKLFKPLCLELTSSMIFGAVSVSTLKYLNKFNELPVDYLLKDLSEMIFYGLRREEGSRG